jgi:hypothetical protein
MVAASGCRRFATPSNGFTMSGSARTACGFAFEKLGKRREAMGDSSS